ncbi:hypothetical protein AcW2_000531 [Taiwanofungus camphoratus]|nr:hypothetical protein AcW2_000531 [Antrodia cinnamomea]
MAYVYLVPLFLKFWFKSPKTCEYLLFSRSRYQWRGGHCKSFKELVILIGDKHLRCSYNAWWTLGKA